VPSPRHVLLRHHLSPNSSRKLGLVIPIPKMRKLRLTFSCVTELVSAQEGVEPRKSKAWALSSPSGLPRVNTQKVSLLPGRGISFPRLLKQSSKH
jgi:hypothetical protein